MRLAGFSSISFGQCASGGKKQLGLSLKSFLLVLLGFLGGLEIRSLTEFLQKKNT